MATIKKEFSQDFYKKLYSEIENDDIEVDDEGSGTYGREYEVDGYIVDLSATFNVRWTSDSFDHAFGTQWYPPYPVLENLIEISDVEIEDKEGNEVDGFDYDQFWKQFERDTYGGIKAGDKVEYTIYSLPPRTGTFISYCWMRDILKVMRDSDGKEIWFERGHGSKIRKL